jgi:thiamine-monophosphate kinase
MRHETLIPKPKPGELALLARIRDRVAKMPRGALHLGIGDDCALLQPKQNEELAVTTDLSIAGRHFRLDWHPPDAVGHRTLARGLSDLAAMGARPLAAFLSLGLPHDLARPKGHQPAWIDRFLDGFLALAGKYDTPLAGGDLAESPLAVADIVLVGAVPRGKALLRSGAKPGDLVYVTGTLGGATAGLAQLGKKARKTRPRSDSTELNTPLTRHLYPQPRIAQGLFLRRRRLATAALDLSDGLSTDLVHLCSESGVGAAIDSAALPIHPAATMQQALHGGEDYELLFTAPPHTRLPRAIAGVPISCIGRIVPRRRARPQITLQTAAGSQPLEPAGWEHFS